MTTRGLAFIVLAALAVGAGAWALRLFVPTDPAPPPAITAVPSPPALGSRAPPAGTEWPPASPAATSVPNADRFKLVGVMAQGAAAGGSEGLALIAVDGQPARPFRVGATVEGDIVVRGVSSRGATLGPRAGGAAMALEVSLAPAPVPATVPVPTAESEVASDGNLSDGSARSQEILRKLGSKHPPLPPQTWPAPQ